VRARRVGDVHGVRVRAGDHLDRVQARYEELVHRVLDGRVRLHVEDQSVHLLRVAGRSADDVERLDDARRAARRTVDLLDPRVVHVVRREQSPRLEVLEHFQARADGRGEDGAGVAAAPGASGRRGPGNRRCRRRHPPPRWNVLEVHQIDSGPA
jgi:hypothetical protein